MPHTPCLQPERFAGQVGGRAVGLFVLEASGLRAAVCNHGARLLELWVPDREGTPRDVVLGHDSLAQLLSGQASMGAFIGRFANRIARAELPLPQGPHRLPANDGPHCLHGGPGGSRHQVFEVLAHGRDHLRLGWTFREADDGFPGEVDLVLEYRLEAGRLVLAHSARVRGAATPLSFTGHAYFNLEGGDAEHALDHDLQIGASRYLPVGADRIPTGATPPVAGSVFDFRSPRTLRDALVQGDAQRALGQPPGFDHCFAIDGQGFRRHARLSTPGSGIAMEVWADAPGLQLYNCAPMDGSLPRHAGKHGRTYGCYAAVCLEPQQWPDAPHQPGFPDVMHLPGTQVEGRIEYRFEAGTQAPGA